MTAPGYTQDPGRRPPDAPPVPAVPEMPRRGGQGGPGRGLIEPPRPLNAIPGWNQEQFQKSVELGPRAIFELSNSLGEVRVTGTDGNTIRLTAVKRVKELNKDAARALLQNVVIRVTERGGGVEVFTENPAGNMTPLLVDFEVAVPVATNVSIRNTGTVRVANIKGELRAEAFAGNMQLTNVARVRQAKTYGGNIVINGAEGEEVSAEASLNGIMQLRGVRARTIELRGYGGRISASDVDCERCEFKTFGGEIEFTGSLRRNGRYAIDSVNGNIRMVIDGNVGFDLEAVSSNVRSDFELKKTAPSPGAAARIVRGSYGDGSAVLTLRTFGGSITVARPGGTAR
jgi:hypothetical protein